MRSYFLRFSILQLKSKGSGQDSGGSNTTPNNSIIIALNCFILLPGVIGSLRFTRRVFEDSCSILRCLMLEHALMGLFACRFIAYLVTTPASDGRGSIMSV